MKLFFYFQVVVAWAFAIPQAIRMMHSVKGMTITWLLFAALFIIFNLVLSLGTYRRNKNEDGFRVLVIYVNWLVLLVPMVVLTLIKCEWVRQDTIISCLIIISSTIIVIATKLNGRRIDDPLTKGLLVSTFRVVPHLYLSYCIVNAGSSNGLSGVTVLAANITATSRVISLYLSGRKHGWEKGRISSLLSEFANETSWLVTTICWFKYS